MVFHWLCIICIVLASVACSDDTEVGYGLLSQEELDVQFKEDLPLVMKTIDSGPYRTYTTGVFVLPSLTIGQTEDPIFGSLTSDIYFSPSLLTNQPLEFSGGTYDSIVLTIRIDTSLYYGSTDAEHNLRIHQLTNPITNDTLRSDASFDVLSNSLGSVDGVIPSNIDTVLVPSQTDSTFIKELDIIRIPLDNALGRSLFADSIAHTSTLALREIFPGFRISDETSNSLFGIRNTSFVTLYYHNAAGAFREYRYFLNGGPYTPHIQHDYAGTPIESLIDVPVSGEQSLYLQGLSGPDVSIDVSAIHDLDNILINHATLEFYLEEQGGRDTLLFPYADQLILQTQGESGLIDIEDVVIAGGLSDRRFFGGIRQQDATKNVFKYEMSITTHLINVFRGRQEDIIYLRIGNKLINPATTILYGPNHPEFPAKLKLTYTKS